MALSPSDYPEYAECISNKKQKPLGWGSRPALLIVDVGKAYVSETSAISLVGNEATCPTAASLVSNVSQLVKAAHEGKCPVVWAQTIFTNEKLRDAGLWPKKVSKTLLQECKGGFLDELQPWKRDDKSGQDDDRISDLVIDKKFASAFFGTNLAAQLTMLSVDTIVVCGATTGGEIRQSVLDGQGLGFRGIIAADACVDTCRETHFANLFDMRAKMGDVVTMEAALDGLRKGWPKLG